MDRYYEIDLLRGLACIAVVAFHYLSRGPQVGWMVDAHYPIANAVAQYGYLGVHLFFIISGFVIMMSAEGASARTFLASRIARLFPAFWVGATLTATTAWAVGDERFMVSLPHYFINLTMLQHWFNIPYIDGAYWSLAYELHFYIYVWFGLQFRLLHRLDLALAAWLLVSVINAVRPMWPVEFWLNAKWAPYFVAGCVFYLIRTNGATKSRWALIAIAYILALIYTLRDARIESGSHPISSIHLLIVAAIVTLFFIVFASITVGNWRAGPSKAASVLGTLTYPVYIIHQVFGFLLYERLRALSGYPFMSLVLTTLIVVGVAWMLHFFVEVPLGPRLKRLCTRNVLVNSSGRGIKGTS
jgi:peptidoglycan/LPS O-acetylase OafA/YrhL